MPLVTVTLMRGSSPEFKKAILDIIHTALVTAFKIPDHDRNQRIIEIDADNYEYPMGKSNHFMTVEMTVFPGRSIGAKRLLYREIVNGLKAIGIPGEDILIILNEPPLENWGIRGGYPASEVDVGFKLDV